MSMKEIFKWIVSLSVVIALGFLLFAIEELGLTYHVFGGLGIIVIICLITFSVRAILFRE